MLRTISRPASRTVFSATRVARTPRVLLPAFQQSLRHESGLPPFDKEKRRQVLEARDDQQRDWDAKVVTYADIKPKTLSPSPDAYLIDVREPDEVIQGSIPSAVNLPLSVLANSLHLDPAKFKQTHGFEKPKKDQEVTFYCRSGVRSSTASDVAKRNGYTNIQNYKGSWLDWLEQDKSSS
ncbi:hypothetical protein PLICRDRAFT_100477 [Plicaturopsis crispa FD-325 SS-3]|nr:hypothetical protein PLICRDRAFT_100477 [Plicaturopsis crispa FD-325 SS-3]